MQIAETACATIFATRKFESAKRIEVLNKAREEVGDYDGPYAALTLSISDCDDEKAYAIKNLADRSWQGSLSCSYIKHWQ